MLLLGSGLRVAARLRHDSRMAYVVVAAWLAFGFYGFHYAVLTKHESLRSRIAGEGSVLFYDDCGSQGLEPHLVPGSGMALPDGGMLGRIVPERTVTGHPQAVVYRYPFTDGMAHDDLQVRLLYFNPDPSTPFVAAAKKRFVYTSQRLRAGSLLLHDEIEITSQPKELVFPIPPGAFSDNVLELRFEKVAGIAACVAEIWIERRWVRQVAAGKIQNRSSRPLALVLVTRDGKGTHNREVTIPAASTIDVQSTQPMLVLLREQSPWMLREAEAHPAPGTRWLGHKQASGGYRIRGTGLLARLPFATEVEGIFLARVLMSSGSGWQLRPLADLRKSDGSLDYDAGTTASSLDYVMLVGGWRPGW